LRVIAEKSCGGSFEANVEMIWKRVGRTEDLIILFFDGREDVHEIDQSNTAQLLETQTSLCVR
jgi:hypothetical protein